jgi:hypothetical protein
MCAGTVQNQEQQNVPIRTCFGALRVGTASCRCRSKRGRSHCCGGVVGGSGCGAGRRCRIATGLGMLSAEHEFLVGAGAGGRDDFKLAGDSSLAGAGIMERIFVWSWYRENVVFAWGAEEEAQTFEIQSRSPSRKLPARDSEKDPAISGRRPRRQTRLLRVAPDTAVTSASSS